MVRIAPSFSEAYASAAPCPVGSSVITARWAVTSAESVSPAM